MKSSNYYGIILAVLAGTAALILLSQFLDETGNRITFGEHGIAESLSAFGYFACVLVMGGYGGSAFLKRNWFLAVILIAFCARELDFDKAFTAEGVLKSRFLMSPDVSLQAKIVAYTILAFVLWCGLLALKNHGPRFWQALRHRSLDPGHWCILLPIILLGVAKTVDGLGRKMKSIGLEVTQETEIISHYAEESMELAAPILFIVAAVYYIRINRIGQNRGRS
ncbi:MAG: hypothetical protein AAF530_11525 [Pseudomonadota bacterium]